MTETSKNNFNDQTDQELSTKNEIQRYIDEKKEIYNNLIVFLEASTDEKENFTNLIGVFNKYGIGTDREEFKQILQLIINISNNHHRGRNLIQKIINIISNYKDQIKQTFSNIEIFSIFKSNKIILLFLFETKLITIDDVIHKEILYTFEDNGNRLCHFFYPEIKDINDTETNQLITNELLSINSNIFNGFDTKRHEGENDSYICSLIRQDSVEEFIQYVNKWNIPISSQIRPSIFETNSFLIENNPSLIEYSAFCGSIQIFQYLKLNNADLENSLLYAIHSGNEELVLLFEDVNGYCIESFIESIKCHHNEIAKYIKSSFSSEPIMDEFLSIIIQSHNYSFFQFDFENTDEFFYFCYYDCQRLKNLFMKNREKYINSLKIYNLKEATNITNGIDIIYSLLDKNMITYNCFESNKNISKIAIPSSIHIIPSCAFYESSLTEISIPSSVTKINECAFAECNFLQDVKIPSSVTEIGNSAFHRCSSLKKIEFEIPSSVEKIDKYAFAKCKKLKQITINVSLESIETGLFFKCKSLSQIIIPLSVTIIEESAFAGCSSLTQIKLPSSLTAIRKNAFEECSSLIKITFPLSVKEIGDEAFKGCASLSEVEILNSDIKFGYGVFDGIISLKITGNIQYIPNKLFAFCYSLTQIEFCSSVTSIGKSAFYGCSSLTQITIPSSVTSIGNSAFCECSSLTQITIPSSVTSIGNYAFYECSSLTQITIPSSVTSIGNYAFSECSSLTQITIPSSLDISHAGLNSQVRISYI